MKNYQAEVCRYQSKPKAEADEVKLKPNLYDAFRSRQMLFKQYGRQ